MADKSEIYSNHSEALEKWISDCFTDHHPPTRYYHHHQGVKNNIPISVPKKEKEKPVVHVVPVPKKKEKEKAVVHEKRVKKLDSVSALEETQRFVANFLRVDDAKRMIASQQPRTTRPHLENNSGVKRKFDDDVNNEVKKIMHRKPEQRKCVADPIGKPSSRGQILANKKYKFQPLVC